MISLYEIHRKYSFENMHLLKDAEKCGCFYCGKIFTPYDIEEWIDDEKDYTALCPYCGIDTVIPAVDNGDYKLTPELLEDLYDLYFTALE